MCFDNDFCDVWDEMIVKARKHHPCDECQDGIQSGELYKRIGSLYEGEWDTLRLCARCVWDHARVYRHELSEGCMHNESNCPVGYLHEHMGELANNARWMRSNYGEEDEGEAPTGWEPSPVTYREQRL